MTGGLGFSKAGQGSLNNNRSLVKKDSVRHQIIEKGYGSGEKREMIFKEATEAELQDLREKLKLEKKQEQRKLLLFCGCFSLFVFIVAFLLFHI